MFRNHYGLNTQNKKLIDPSELENLIALRDTADDIWQMAENLPYDDEISRESTNAKFEEAFEIYARCYDSYNQYKKKYGDIKILLNNQDLMFSIPPHNTLCVAEHFYFLTKTLADAYYEMGHCLTAIPLYNEAREYLIYCESKNIDNTLKDVDIILKNLNFNAALNKLVLAEQTKAANQNYTELTQEVTDAFINHLKEVVNDKKIKPYEIHLALEYILRVRKLVTDQLFHFKEARDLERLKWCIVDILNQKQLRFLIQLPLNTIPISLQDLMGKLTPKLNLKQWKKFRTYINPLTKKRKRDQTIQEYASEIADKMVQFNASNEFDKLKLYPHQQEALAKIAAHFAGGNTKAGITMATGTGKTHVFISFLLAAQTLLEKNADNNEQAFIVVPQLSLSDQTFDRIKQLMNDCHLQCDIGVFNGYQKSQRKITIITLDSLQNEMSKSPSQRRLDMSQCRIIIIDEVHLALSQKCKELIFELSQNKLILTFTATDTYNTIRLHGALRSVKELIGEENCIYHYPLLKAIEDNVLAPVRVCIVNGISQIPQRKLGAISKDSEVNLQKLSDHLGQDNFDEINSTVVEQYLHVLHPDTKESLIGKSSFAFCVSIRHAETLTNKLNKTLADNPFFKHANIIPAAAISGHHSAAQQAKLLDDFRKGHIKILCGADILITGVDVPDIEIIFNVRPTRSNVLAAQRFGRLTRRSPSNPNKIGLVFEYPMVSHQVFATRFLNDKQQAGLLPILTDENIKFNREQIPVNARINGACQWEMRWDSIKKPLSLETPTQMIYSSNENLFGQQSILKLSPLPIENKILPNENASSTTAINLVLRNENNIQSLQSKSINIDILNNEKSAEKVNSENITVLNTELFTQLKIYPNYNNSNVIYTKESLFSEMEYADYDPYLSAALENDTDTLFDGFFNDNNETYSNFKKN